MLRTSVYVKLCIHLSSQRSLRKHALYSELDNLLRLLVHHLTQGGLFHTAYVIRVMIVNLLIQLLAGYFDLVCIYNDYIISGVDVRSKDCFVLTSQNFSYF